MTSESKQEQVQHMDTSPESGEKKKSPSSSSKPVKVLQYNLTFHPSTKVLNAGIFRFLNEDATLANVLTTQLLNDSRVTYAAWNRTHPQARQVRIDCKTKTDTTDPIGALTDASVQVADTLVRLQAALQVAVDQYRV